MFRSVKHLHFVGIGGIGMSGIAEILLEKGFTVSGSDLNPSQNTDYLKNKGIDIFIGHSASNINGAEVIVYSSAVNINENPEIIQAKKNNIPVIRRAEMLAEVSRLNYSIGVAGTHGKTTTTSMLGLILIEAGLDPTVIVGGRLKDFGGTNARLGNGEWTVVEADEFDRSFLQLFPTISIINNVEAEHLDIYRDLEDIEATFTEFANKTPFYGLCALGLDDDGVKNILPSINKQIKTFGFNRNCDIRADKAKYENGESYCDVYEDGKKLGGIHIRIPGEYNLKNALGALTVARNLGIEFDIIKNALSKFSGVFRRFEIKGEYKGIKIIDDYAHHPSEVKACLEGARKAFNNRIVCLFQPHTFTRTRDQYKDFAKSFDNADLLFVTDIYPAREQPIEGISGKLIADEAVSYGYKNVNYINKNENIIPIVKEHLKEGDIFITMGAGNIWKYGLELIDSQN
ncbi:UDP-N-acetylmuramate--L-alanine ligase [Candidatus Kapabacteria bacterium]|nr:UDP-N-acetylmuramate--L-alanine ligase [Candidatus Kapabacteria bacterium]